MIQYRTEVARFWTLWWPKAETTASRTVAEAFRQGMTTLVRMNRSVYLPASGGDARSNRTASPKKTAPLTSAVTV